MLSVFYLASINTLITLETATMF